MNGNEGKKNFKSPNLELTLRQRQRGSSFRLWTVEGICKYVSFDVDSLSLKRYVCWQAWTFWGKKTENKTTHKKCHDIKRADKNICYDGSWILVVIVNIRLV